MYLALPTPLQIGLIGGTAVVAVVVGSIAWRLRTRPHPGGTLASRLFGACVVAFVLASGSLTAMSVRKEARLTVLSATCDDRDLFLEDISDRCGAEVDLPSCADRIARTSDKAAPGSVRLFRTGDPAVCAGKRLAELTARRVVVVMDGLGTVVDVYPL